MVFITLKFCGAGFSEKFNDQSSLFEKGLFYKSVLFEHHKQMMYIKKWIIEKHEDAACHHMWSRV